MKLLIALAIAIYHVYFVASCGMSYSQSGRVINGKNASPGKWPWQCILKVNGRPGCGGSVISDSWIMTAAHCVDQIPRFGRLSVVLGKTYQNRREYGEQEIQAYRYIVHPRWSRRTFDYDFALIQLSRKVRFSKTIQPVCLPPHGYNPPDGTSCYITGFGKVHPRGDMWHTLQEAPMTVVNQRQCHYKNYNNIRVAVTPRMICGQGGYRVSGCQGDSGGPFVCNTNGRYILHGAVSHGSTDCNSAKTYTVFARISAVRDWIKGIAGF